MTGGKGKDVFEYYGGNDVITDYTAGQDSIYTFWGDYSITSSSINGNDVILGIVNSYIDENNDSINAEGTITIQKGKDKQITIGDIGDYDSISTSTQIYGDNASTLIASADNTTINSNTINNFSLVNEIDASKLKVAVNVTSNDKDNVINGGTAADTLVGGSGDDTFTGGKGNDTITGGEGSNVFVYTNGDGKDVIVDFTSDDKIKLGKSTAIKGMTFDEDDFVLSIGSGSITLKDAVDKTIRIEDSTGKTTTYSQSSDFVATNADVIEDTWFTQDDVISSEIDSIIQTTSTNYSVGEIVESNLVMSLSKTNTLTALTICNENNSQK